MPLYSVTFSYLVWIIKFEPDGLTFERINWYNSVEHEINFRESCFSWCNGTVTNALFPFTLLLWLSVSILELVTKQREILHNLSSDGEVWFLAQHAGVMTPLAETDCLLGCCAVKSGRNCPTFQTRQKVLWNLGKFTIPHYTMRYSRILYCQLQRPTSRCENETFQLRCLCRTAHGNVRGAVHSTRVHTTFI
jgi:hypothetical protein